MPITFKRWFVDRIRRELESSKENQSSKALQHNTPDARAMMGKQRAQVPAKLRRFT